MSSEQTFSTSDLRSTAQDYKRDAARKHKWALGTTAGVGRAADKPRPHRPSETDFNARRREAKAAVATLAHGTKLARRHDMLEGTALSSDESAGTNSDEYDNDLPSSSSPSAAAASTAVDPSLVMYSFDAPRGPSHGSQILNVALAKAVAKFEEKETLNLVKAEYDMIDSEGETVAMSPVKKPAKGKGKAKGKAKAASVVVPDADEDYEFV